MAVSASEVEEFCVSYLRRTLDIPPEQVSPEASFARLGLDSASSVHLLVELEEWAGIELDPEAVFDHPTIAEFARHVAATATSRGEGP